MRAQHRLDEPPVLGLLMRPADPRDEACVDEARKPASAQKYPLHRAMLRRPRRHPRSAAGRTRIVRAGRGRAAAARPAAPLGFGAVGRQLLVLPSVQGHIEGWSSMRTSGAASIPRFPADPRLRQVLVAYGLSRFTEFAGWLAVLLVAYHLGGATLSASRRSRCRHRPSCSCRCWPGSPIECPAAAARAVPCRGGRVHRCAGRPAVPRRPLLADPHRRRCHDHRGLPRPADALRDASLDLQGPGTWWRPTAGPRSWTAGRSSSGSPSRGWSPRSSVRGRCFSGAPR